MGAGERLHAGAQHHAVALAFKGDLLGQVTFLTAFFGIPRA
ncbi:MULTISPECIES: hypothetical protein [unclassified Serratia (in: enterobacteria)]|nr:MULTISPECIES: hypothetical protein [unclassified Serratia (in: enterobacteria)]